jgi:hypothetical protein
MTDNSTKPVRPATLQADRDSLAALKNITDYAPANPDYSAKSLEDAEKDYDDKLDIAAQKEAEAKASRDDAITSGWSFHRKVVGMRDSVGVQYGKNSNEFQTVGRKKTSDYKKPKRASKSSAK